MRAVAECNFLSSTKIAEDLYLVEREPKTASCRKPLQTAYATLSNAKYWFIRFVYAFMYKCLDMSRIHFIVCDTDSYMWAVAGTGRRERILRESVLRELSERGKEKIMCKIVPHFEDVVLDREFYEKHYDSWFPKKKTLLTLCYEHCCQNMIALAPKNYWYDGKVKLKGVSVRGNLNTHINEQAFLNNIKEGLITGAENYCLRQKGHVMTKQLLRKTGLSGVITKSVVLENQACLPFLFGINAEKYFTC